MADGKPTQGERLANLESGVTALSDKINAVIFRLDKQDGLIDSLHKLASSVEVLANDLRHTNKKVDEIDGQVKCLMLEPGKKWNSVSLGLVSTIIAAIVGVVVGKFI